MHFFNHLKFFLFCNLQLRKNLFQIYFNYFNYLPQITFLAITTYIPSFFNRLSYICTEFHRLPIYQATLPFVVFDDRPHHIRGLWPRVMTFLFPESGKLHFHCAPPTHFFQPLLQLVIFPSRTIRVIATTMAISKALETFAKVPPRHFIAYRDRERRGGGEKIALHIPEKKERTA